MADCLELFTSGEVSKRLAKLKTAIQNGPPVADEETINKFHQEMKALIKDDPKLHGLDDWYTKRFLRARVLDPSLAAKTLESYESFMSEPGWRELVWDHMRCLLSNVMTIWCDHDGGIVWVRGGAWNPRLLSGMDAFKAGAAAADFLSVNSSVQAKGIVVIFDMKNIGRRHIKSINLTLFRRILFYLTILNKRIEIFPSLTHCLNGPRSMSIPSPGVVHCIPVPKEGLCSSLDTRGSCD